MNRTFSLSFLPLVFCLSSCGSNEEGGVGTLNVILTDAPACGFEHVFVTVKSVRVHRSEGAGPNESGWYELKLPIPQKIDLLSLSNGVFLTLGQTPLPAGNYQQIRLILDDNSGSGALRNSVVPDGGSEQALDSPSASQSGYKVIGNFAVQRDTLIDLVLDFDACHSIVQKGNGGFALKPVVKATPLQISGIIEGYVSPADAGTLVLAEQDGKVIKATVADSTGRFILSPVAQSTSVGDYDLVLVREGDATVIVRGIPVAAGASTRVSTLTEPFTLPSASTSTVSGAVLPVSTGGVVTALQFSSGGSYTIASANANLDTGAYGLSLSTAAPLVGDFTGTLPVSLTADPLAAGQYSIRAMSLLGATQTIVVDLLSGNASGVDFLF
jgi:hypothetical protein